MLTVERQNDFLLTWRGLQNAATGEFINSGATVSLRMRHNGGDLVHTNGTPIHDDHNTVPMLYVEGSDGNYQGVISRNVLIGINSATGLPPVGETELKLGPFYFIDAIAVFDGGNFAGYIKEDVTLVQRTS